MKGLFTGIVLIALLALALPAAAQEMTPMPTPTLLISGAWARPTAVMAEAEMHGAGEMPMAEATPEATAASGMQMGQTTAGGMTAGRMQMGSMEMGRGADGVSAAYMTIENAGDLPLRLSAAASAAAGMVEIHETRMEGDLMQMRRVEGGIVIPAGETVELKPGGYHVMLMELRRNLLTGQAISLRLTFDRLDAEANPTGDTLEVMLGVPVLETPAEPGPVIAVNAWARPTAPAVEETDGMHGMHGMHGGMAEAAPEATAEGGMAMGGMHGGSDDVSAAYMLLLNRGSRDEQLVAARTDASNQVEIHEIIMEGDLMKMRPVEGGIVVPAGGMVQLRPGGYHVMLMELTRELLPGEALVLTLTFASGLELTIGVPIYDGMGM